MIYVNIDATGANNGSSWDDAYTSLQDALGAWTAGDQIWVAEGRYFPDVGTAQTLGDRTASFVLSGDMQLYGGFEGGEGALGDRDPAAHVTVLSGDIDQNDGVDPNGLTLNWTLINGANSHHVVQFTGAGNTVILDGFAVSGGYAVATDSNEIGGGIWIHEHWAAHPQIRNAIIQANRAWRRGGGLHTRTTPLTVLDTIIANNAADDDALSGIEPRPEEGGMVAINNFCGSTPVDVVLRRVTFEGNSADQGGGLFSLGAGCTPGNHSTGLILDDVVFSSNIADWRGGGMESSLVEFDMSNVTFESNRVDVPNIVRGNLPLWGGGGLALLGPFSYPTMTNVAFKGNQARTDQRVCNPRDGYGGALHVFDAGPVMTNVLFSGNRSDATGGALFFTRSTIDTTIFEIVNSTFVGNLIQQCQDGHAIHNDSPLGIRLSNSIVWGNFEGGVAALKGGANLPTGSIATRDSIIEGCDDSSPISDDCGLSQGGVQNVNPLFFDPTPFMVSDPTTAGNNRLQIGSPAIDMGNPAFVPAGVTTDLDRLPRFVDGNGDGPAEPDMGAYEQQLRCLPPGVTVARVDKDATGANTGVTWADALPTLQDALLIYNSCPGTVDEIWVAEGVYYPDRGGPYGSLTNVPIAERRTRSFHLTNDGTGAVHIYGGFDGTENSIDDRGSPEENITVLSGDIEQDDTTDANGVVLDPSGIVETNSNHVLYGDAVRCDPEASAPASCLLLDRLTVTGGDAWTGQGNAGDTPEAQGGGMWLKNSDIRMNQVRFQGNQARKGGGLHMAVAGTYHLMATEFENNRARVGGGFSVVGDTRGSIRFATFKGNHANVAGSGTPIGGDGGGLFVEPGPFGDTNSPIRVNIGNFQGNLATGEGRGEGHGGAMAVRGSTPRVSVDRTTFRSNYAQRGGAIANLEGAESVFFDSLISGNVANVTGGGMYNNASSPQLTNITVASNRATDSGGGMANANGSNPPIRNSILWLNSSTIVNDETSTPVVSYSMLEGCGPFGQPPTLDPACGSDGGGNIEPDDPTDPIFVDPIDPATAPSPLGDFHLDRNSPAVDTGNNDYNGHPGDLEGSPRIVDGNVDGTATIDMGAYEAPPAGRIVTKKETLPAGSPWGFFFELTSPQGEIVNFALQDGESFDPGNLAPGTYSLVESPDPLWYLASATCDDGSDPASIDLAGGETVTCTFQNVIVDAQNCTHTLGYWNTHSSYGPAGPADDGWYTAFGPYSPGADGPDAPLFDSGLTWFEAFNTKPRGSNAWFILAHQWMAADLNYYNGAGAGGTDVVVWLSEGAALLDDYDDYDDGSPLIPKRTAAWDRAVMLADLLDQYNIGTIGPGFCDH